MADTNIDVDELDLSDAELMKLLKNHGMGRRTLMKAVGAGAGVAAFSGLSSAKPGKGVQDIDKVYGASFEAGGANAPPGLIDHTVDLHIHPGKADHPEFPMVDEDGDGMPDSEGPETFFDPVGLRVKPSEIVEFTVHGPGLHTVTSFDPKFNEPPFLVLPKRVPEDVVFTSPPVADGDSWLYRFTKEGVYDIFCLPHVSLGMVARIVVVGDDSEVPSAYPDSEIPNLPNANDVYDVPEMNPEYIVNNSPVAWDELSL